MNYREINLSTKMHKGTTTFKSIFEVLNKLFVETFQNCDLNTEFHINVTNEDTEDFVNVNVFATTNISGYVHKTDGIYTYTECGLKHCTVTADSANVINKCSIQDEKISEYQLAVHTIEEKVRNLEIDVEVISEERDRYERDCHNLIDKVAALKEELENERGLKEHYESISNERLKAMYNENYATAQREAEVERARITAITEMITFAKPEDKNLLAKIFGELEHYYRVVKDNTLLQNENDELRAKVKRFEEGEG